MLERRFERAGSAYSDEDLDYSMELRRYIEEKEKDIQKIADSWSETSADFRNKASAELNRRENLPALDGKEEMEQDDPPEEEAKEEKEEAERDQDKAVPAAGANQDAGEMVTDAEIEEILDAIEDEDDMTDKEEENDVKGKGKVEDEANTNNREETDAMVAAADKETKVAAADKKVKTEVDTEEKKEDEKDEGGEEEMNAEIEQEEAPPAPAPGAIARDFQAHLRPFCLSLQDGAADLPVWMRKMRTYFLLSNYAEKEPSLQQAVVMAHMDTEMGKFLQQEIMENGVEVNLTNLLAAIPVSYTHLTLPTKREV